MRVYDRCSPGLWSARPVLENLARLRAVAEELAGRRRPCGRRHEEGRACPTARPGPAAPSSVLAKTRRSPRIAWKNVSAHSTGKSSRRVAELLADLPRAREDGVSSSGAAHPLIDPQREAADHLQAELELHALGGPPAAAQSASSPRSASDRCLAEREQRRPRAGPRRRMHRALVREVARPFEESRRAAPRCGGLVAVMRRRANWRPGPLIAARRVGCRRRVEHVLVEDVDEPVVAGSACDRGTPARRRASRTRARVRATSSRSSTSGGSISQRLAERRRIELVALHAGGDAAAVRSRSSSCSIFRAIIPRTDSGRSRALSGQRSREPPMPVLLDDAARSRR